MVPETPLQLARLASGRHQKLQTTARRCTTEDIIRQLARSMKVKREKNPDDWILNDMELFNVIESLGLTIDTEYRPPARQSKKPESELKV